METKMPSLLNLSLEAKALSNVIDDYVEKHEGDVTDLSPAIEGWLADAQAKLSDKVDAIVSVMREIEAMKEAREHEAARIRLLARQDEAKLDRLKEYIKLCMDNMGADRLKGWTHEVKVVNNGGALPLKFDPSVTVDSLPPELVKVTRTPDFDAIRYAINNGTAVPGVEFGQRGTHLRCK
jgi:hypothetical protein